jgi:transcriptional regulator with XRE-family HTH domain
MGLSQQSVADLFDWNRDAMSKVETGKNNLTLHQYLTLVRFLQEAVPLDHPALALADQLSHRRVRR